MQDKIIAVVDYGAGNVQSVANALEAIGANALLTTDPDFIRSAAGVIVPGVGAAQDTISNLESRGLVAPVLDVIRADTPYLGICMGMQALMSYSEENGGQRCLDIIPGAVRRFETKLPVPHMGWNQVRATVTGAGHPIMAGIPDGADFYFVHSFVCAPDDASWTIATTGYDGEFACMLGRGNMIGTQFHPEKSGPFGLRLLQNFVHIVDSGGVEPARRGVRGCRPVTLTVVPAIDLRGGRCVRLVQGDFDRETVFSDDPLEVALRWQSAGACRLHVVDLDGARDGLPAQRDVIGAIVRELSIPVQVGGGVRTRAHAEALLDAGVDRVILGTSAIEHPELVDELLADYSAERVVVGVDARGRLVATRGWTTTSDIGAEELIARMRDRGVQRIVYTDIDRDGTLVSPNFDAIERMAGLGVALVASGGVATTQHLHRLAAIPGVDEAIVGRALYTGDVVLTGADWSLQ